MNDKDAPNIEGSGARKKDTVSFTIDGRSFEVEDEKQTAGELLRLAGLDPNGYDLAEVRAGGQLKQFRDDQPVNIKDGDSFVSVREEASVA